MGVQTTNLGCAGSRCIHRIERIDVKSTATGTTVNSRRVMQHVFEAVVDGQVHEVFQHRGYEDEAPDILRLLESALTAPYADERESLAAA